MPVSAKQARELALALALSSEAPHFDRMAFRTPRRIFATLAATGKDVNFMFDAPLQEFYCGQAPNTFSPVPGGWGKMGATCCDLKKVDRATFQSALKAAHDRAMPVPKKPRGRK